jgi:hypothetical protein
LNYKIFQICFDPKQLHDVDLLLTPFDNTSNERPELREFHSFEKIVDEGHANNLDAWGVFGPRWKEKMRFDALEMHTAIENNPDNDVYIFNHARVVNSLTHNVWEQGEFWHKGIKHVTKVALESCGYDSNVLNLPDVETTCYCSYFVATKEFWNDYIKFLREMKTALENLTGEESEIYKGSANYSRDSNLNLFPFIVERLFTTFLHLKQYKVYSHNPNYELYRKNVGDFVSVLTSLYELKKVSQYDENMFNIWNSIRTFFLKTQPQLMSLD